MGVEIAVCSFWAAESRFMLLSADIWANFRLWSLKIQAQSSRNSSCGDFYGDFGEIFGLADIPAAIL